MDLEKLYSPSQYSKRYAPNEVIKKHVEFIEERKLNIYFIFIFSDIYINSSDTELVNGTIPQKLGVSYGPGRREKYNLYGTNLPDGKLRVLYMQYHLY